MEAIIAAIAEAIAEKLATDAYDRLTSSDGGDGQAETLTQLSQQIQDSRISDAKAHHQNAATQVNFYRNDKPNRQSSLHDGEVENGYAMATLEDIGLPVLHTWMCAAELQMSILQEWLVILGNAGEQQNINDHYNYAYQQYTKMRDLYFDIYDYCCTTSDREDPQAIWFYCGTDTIHFPSDDETNQMSYLQYCRTALAKMKTIVTLSKRDGRPLPPE
jgi:hypothetical protein